MESWMVRCKLLDFRKRNAEMSKLSRSPSRTLREILNVNDNMKNKLRARGDTKLFSSLENSFDKDVILTTDNCLNCI